MLEMSNSESVQDARVLRVSDTDFDNHISSIIYAYNKAVLAEKSYADAGFRCELAEDNENSRLKDMLSGALDRGISFRFWWACREFKEPSKVGLFMSFPDKGHADRFDDYLDKLGM